MYWAICFDVTDQGGDSGTSFAIFQELKCEENFGSALQDYIRLVLFFIKDL